MDFLQHTLDGLLEAGPYALVGLGLNLGFGMLRRLNLAYGASAMLGAYLGSWLYTRMDWPAWAVLPSVVVTVALVGAYVQWLCFDHVDDQGTAAPRLNAVVSDADAREVVALAASFAIWMQLEQLCVNGLPRHLNPFPDIAPAWPCARCPTIRWPRTCRVCASLTCSAWVLCWPVLFRAWPSAPYLPWKARSHRCSACGC